MDGKGEVGVGLCFGVGQRSIFELLGRALEAMAERLLFIGVAQFTKQAAHFVGALPCGPNDSQSSLVFETSGLNVLQKETFELAAVSRPVGINAAAAAIEGRAGLGKLGDSRGTGTCGKVQTLDFGL